MEQELGPSHSASFDHRRRPEDVAHRNGDGLLLSNQDDEPFPSVEEIAQSASARRRSAPRTEDPVRTH